MGARLILVGRVSGAFGVKGELRIGAYTADPLALRAYGVLKREDGSPAFALTSARLGKGPEIVARVEGVSDKDAADALRGLRLYVSREALPAVEDEDDFYQADLIGLAAEDPAGVPLGRVKAVHDFGAGDVLEVEPGPGATAGRPSFLIAFTRANAPVVDIGGGRIVLIRPAETEAGDEGEPGAAPEG